LSLRLDDYMKKNRVYIGIGIIILICILIGRYLFYDNNPDYYKNYNRVIPEPDSIKVIGGDL